MHSIKQAEVCGDGLCEFFVGSGCEHDFSLGLAFGPQPVHHFGAIGQTCRIKFHAPGDFVLEAANAAGKPDRKHECIQRIGPEQREDAFPQQVGRDQRAIEIDG